MKIVQVNVTCGAGSTGKICVAVSDLLTQAGVENHILYTSGHSEHPAGKKYMSAPEVKLQALKSRITGNYGFQSAAATRRLIAELEQIAPDVVHLHNLHSHNVHLGLLLSYLKGKKIKVFWTFHDCWAFTGYCPHYDMTGCDRWQTGCGDCPQKSRFSWFIDRSHALYEKKKQLLTGLNLTIITPSEWLAEQVKRSFLRDCPVRVIRNGINLSVFQPEKSDFRAKYHIGQKHILLGVAFDWGQRKGLDVFLRLAQRLDSDKFQIVLVGTDDNIDKQLPSDIISIHRTANQSELAEIYAAADLLVNPTREDTFPTVNMESLACGTPVLTFRTGGSPEIPDETCGRVVDRNDEEALYQAILELMAHPLNRDDCLRRAAAFDEKDRFREYAALYGEVSE